MSKKCESCNGTGLVKTEVLREERLECVWCSGRGYRLGMTCSDCGGAGYFLKFVRDTEDQICVICGGIGYID